MNKKTRNLLVALTAGAISSAALAGGGPPEMPPIVFPVDTDSVVTGFLGAGGVILLAVISIGLPFLLVRKLLRRASGSI